VQFPVDYFLSSHFGPSLSWIGSIISISWIQFYEKKRKKSPESVEGLFSSLTFAEYMASSQERC
jgi:hypothetical protein